MDIAFFDPDRSHADHLRSALESFITTDAIARKWRSAKYGVDAAQWRRGSTPDDVRAGYDERLQAALRELKEATPESDDEDGDGGAMMVQAWPRAKGWGGKGDLATPPTSGDEDDFSGAGLKRKRAISTEEGVDVKRICVETRVSTFGSTSQSSPKRRSQAPRRFPRIRRADGIELYNTHSMTTRSKTRKVRNPG
ncbi:hypothetical protein GTA08_BOTSDO12333 [Botryosphaeria dothidea]|uniref:Uncharacterized protein n=1 Tax=Botryosphaeria dothidea TaxID=55169 RepID=A0A8H4J353_9PEZI|nr:hypothetical protein GTA08_BOTSDO12333 [Botryosphaeria dothidea]